MRKAVLTRKTKETDIKLTLCLDEAGTSDINTGIGFFDHMLDVFALRAGVTLRLVCKGDLHVDGHHTVEDAGICLGQALHTALGDKKGIARYGAVSLPMDEALVNCALDISGRGLLVYNADLPTGCAGGFDGALAEEFFRAVAHNAGITLHINLMYGHNLHHIIEGMFKAFGQALGQAARVAANADTVPSTKGVL